MRLFMIIDLYVGYKEACCYGVEKVENSTIIVMESEVWYFIRNQQIEVDISLILGNLITVIVDYQIPHKPLKILSL